MLDTKGYNFHGSLGSREREKKCNGRKYPENQGKAEGARARQKAEGREAIRAKKVFTANDSGNFLLCSENFHFLCFVRRTIAARNEGNEMKSK